MSDTSNKSNEHPFDDASSRNLFAKLLFARLDISSLKVDNSILEYEKTVLSGKIERLEYELSRLSRENDKLQLKIKMLQQDRNLNI